MSEPIPIRPNDARHATAQIFGPIALPIADVLLAYLAANLAEKQVTNVLLARIAEHLENGNIDVTVQNGNSIDVNVTNHYQI